MITFIDSQLGPPAPATSIPLAAQRACARRIHEAVPMHRALNRPTEEWWASLASQIRDECRRTVDRQEPATHVYVDVRRVVQITQYGEEMATGELDLNIQATPTFAALEFRLFVLCWTGHGLRLDPVSHNAWCEAWRSIYAPDARGGMREWSK